MSGYKERPILMSGEMVRAILAGRKTQTRRIVNRLARFGKITEFGPSDTPRYDWSFRDKRMRWNDIVREHLADVCPYGQPGDRFWVREAWAVGNIYDRIAPRDICLDIRSKEGRDPAKAPCKVAYPASGGCAGLKGRPSIHMPRWASRITLEITEVRVERLNDISSQDALAEGVGQTEFWTPSELEGRPFEEKWWDDYHFFQNYPQIAFERLWESINGPGSWEANPWVWVVEFRRIEVAQ